MKKVLSFVLVLSLVLGSVSMAFANTTNSVAKVPTVAAEADIPTVELALVVNDANGIKANTADSAQKIKLTLENGTWGSDVDTDDRLSTVTTQAITTANAVGVYVDGANASMSTATALSVGDDYLELSFEDATDIDKDQNITLRLNICSGSDAGEVKIAIDGLDSQISSGTYTVAVVGTDNTVTTVNGDAVETGRASAVKGATIEIRETAVNSVDGTQHIKFSLPKGFTWSDKDSKGNAVTGAALSGDMLKAVTSMTITGEGRDLEIKFNAADNENVREVLVVTPYINVNREAKLGDVAVQLRAMESSTDIDNETGLVIAEYLEEGVVVSTVDEEDLPEIVAGRVTADGTLSGDDYIVEITLEETQDKSLIDGKYVNFEFPEYVQITSGRSIEYDFNAQTKCTAGLDYEKSAGKAVITGENNSFEWEVCGDNTLGKTVNNKKADAVTFYVPVTVEAGTPAGDLEVVVTGAKAGVDETKLVVAKILAPITVEYSLSDVKTGVQNQAVADITIKENFVGALCDENGFKTVAVAIDNNGQRFDFNSAVAEVVAGDLEIKEEADRDLVGDDGVIYFTIERSSIKTPGEIKISGIEVTMDRTPAEGKYAVLVGGSALVNNELYLDFDGKDGEFSDWAVAADYINVVTPADQGVNATFKIGESKYTVNGVEVTMDAPSYVDDNNRTMVSIRYIANALGVSDNAIIWNEAAQTATIFGKSTVVVTIGEDHITVNGSVVPMDTQAVNKAGRIYVPLRYIANALGAAVEWNQEAQTATIITLANN